MAHSTEITHITTARGKGGGRKTGRRRRRFRRVFVSFSRASIVKKRLNFSFFTTLE